MPTLQTTVYKKDFVSTFPGDETGNKGTRQTPGKLYSKAEPTPVKQPQLLAWSDDLAAELELTKPATQEEVDILGGNLVTSSMYPYAACYAGHQFGNWAGQLGDGRAIMLGELETGKGKVYELQLKGAGPTPYSRRADGRAVLRSSVREYLMSEAMHYLGVPTTRALSLVSTGDKVLRDMFYNGNAAYEPGAIVMRIAPSFLRFGNFEMLASRSELDNLRNLTEWTIARFYPQFTGEDKVLRFFEEVLRRTAQLMVEWQRVGFVHGVMNTDNMSILGLTIDYGPFSFLDDYDLSFTPNTTDLPGRRYAFGRQPKIAHWNLACLAGALAPLFQDTEELQAVLHTYDEVYAQYYHAMLGNKLGLDEVREGDAELLTQLQQMLATVKSDMTIFFQLLIDWSPTQTDKNAISNHFQDSFYHELQPGQLEALTNFITDYTTRLQSNTISRGEAQAKMRKANPRFVLRNYLLSQAIEELEKGENGLFIKLQAAMKDPYSDKYPEFFTKRPEWAASKAGCSMLSCSS